jgi:hypothetical protein
MLAADRSLLEVNLRQSAIKLREKELNLYVENYSAMGTQAAVLAGFTTTCLIEITIPTGADVWAVCFLHVLSVISIAANITCVSLSTMTTIWGSSKALRGKDGSMDEAVDGISRERGLIFNSFAIGLAGNLCTVMAACVVLMDIPTALVGCIIIVYAGALIWKNSRRILTKFDLIDATRLDDLTSWSGHGGATMMGMSTSAADGTYRNRGGGANKSGGDLNV